MVDAEQMLAAKDSLLRRWKQEAQLVRKQICVGTSLVIVSVLSCVSKVVLYILRTCQYAAPFQFLTLLASIMILLH